MMKGVKVFGLVTHRYYSKDKHKKKKKSEQEEEEEVIINVNESWSELGPDLLGEIVSRLCLTDQARFLVVCKNWLAAAKVTTKSSPSSSLPWLGRIIPGSPTQFQIFDPLSSPITPASIQNISWSNLGIPSPPPPSTLFIAYIQHNWLLLCFKKPRLFPRPTCRYFLMFSPLTKKVITLPKYDHSPRLKFTAAFSTQPDSPDCVYCLIDSTDCVYCLINPYCTHKISVITYRNGDKKWTARQFNKVPGFLSCTLHPLILDGIIYIVTRFGQVASYNILNGESNFDCLSMDALLVQNARSKRIWKVFVLNEEPMILYYDPDGTKDVTHPQCIKRYDRSRKVWIPATTLLGYTLFFGQKIYNVSLINTKEGNGVLSNKIYHFVNGGCHVYSLENGNLVWIKSINSYFLEDELPEYKYKCKYNYNGIPPDTRVMTAYWLTPPCVRSSSDNQDYEGLSNPFIISRQSGLDISHDSCRIHTKPGEPDKLVSELLNSINYCFNVAG